MNNNQYLDEEKYQKANKKIKKAGVIVLIIGLIMLIAGISLITYGIITDKIRTAGIGGPFLILGIGITIWGLMIRFLIGNQRQISAYMMQQQMPITQEGLEKMTPTMGNAAKEITKGIKEGLKDDEK